VLSSQLVTKINFRFPSHSDAGRRGVFLVKSKL
jgi:hypothetical protein